LHYWYAAKIACVKAKSMILNLFARIVAALI
jgi:hypothetical protein